MNKMRPSLILAPVFLLAVLVGRTRGVTDYLDVLALQDLYGALNSPKQLTGWNSIGGDPCAESWKGVSCFGSAVVSIRLSGLGISGTLGHHLSGLRNVNSLDVSNNSIGDTIPSELPTSISYLDLSANKFSGNIPFVFSAMMSLNYLNLSHNLLTGSIGNIFTNLKKLSVLDLSFNKLAGDLPISFSSMSSLSVLNLQGNDLTGSVTFLVGLPLSNLNIENNQFSGYIPKELDLIPDHRTAGNKFQNSDDSQTGNLTRVPITRHTLPSTAHNISYRQQNELTASRNFPPYGGSKYHNKRAIPGKVAGAVTATIFVATCLMLVVIFRVRRCVKTKHEKRHRIDGCCDTLPITSDDELSTNYVRAHLSPNSSKVAPLHSKSITLRLDGRRNVWKGADTNATSYSLIDLQSATENFSAKRLLGEGSTGCVYMAKFPNNQVLAVKKLELLPSLREREQFLEIVSNLSQLRHPNIVNLVGYCAEHGQHLLVYEYISSTTLHDALHCVGNTKKVLTWDARLDIALGVARALEYLHVSCLPSVIHGNVKASNVLLDDDLFPQLSDCGLALVPNARRQTSSLLFYSSGYTAPESTMVGIYSEKGDVYSLGVIMLELLTKRKPKDSLLPRCEQYLVRWFGSRRQDSKALMEIVDPAICGISSSFLLQFADIAVACVQSEPESRPQISEVVAALLHLFQNASPNSAEASDDASFWSSGTAFESSPL
ncbi:protein STRUBBELIG-RECEPTOR FAMILY 8-like isoform X2 [Nymphaea colorata]|nr:protein STRUBBELIG-RECEPTOR FAMILY 8-like isoform X2 [Nymphaea colorata]